MESKRLRRGKFVDFLGIISSFDFVSSVYPNKDSCIWGIHAAVLCWPLEAMHDRIGIDNQLN